MRVTHVIFSFSALEGCSVRPTALSGRHRHRVDDAHIEADPIVDTAMLDHVKDSMALLWGVPLANCLLNLGLMSKLA